MRVTYKTLGEEVSKFNVYLESDGIPKRFECGRRNGYTALDVYSVNADGVRENSGVDCNACCGSPRECCEAVYDTYRQLYSDHFLKPKAEFADFVLGVVANSVPDNGDLDKIFSEAVRRGYIK